MHTCYRPQRSWGKVIFSEACVHILSTEGGACMGCSWGGACMVLLWGGGVCGYSGGGGGHVWLLPRGGGHVWLLWGEGACVVALAGVQQGAHAWLLWGGMCGCSRGGGHVWLLPWGGHVWDTTRIRRYGQWAGGTHPTGMHSCFKSIWQPRPSGSKCSETLLSSAHTLEIGLRLGNLIVASCWAYAF